MVDISGGINVSRKLTRLYYRLELRRGISLAVGEGQSSFFIKIDPYRISNGLRGGGPLDGING